MIRRFLLSTTALLAVAGSGLAADLPYREPPPVYTPPVPIFTWTGVYLGGQLGYGWGADSFTVFAPASAFYGQKFTPNGIVGGAHVGYNLQLSQIVLGLEGDVEGTGYNTAFNSGVITLGTRLPVQGSIRARLGFALDRVLLYATGGVAFTGFTHTYSSFLGYDTVNSAHAGWTVGGGLEYAVTNNWSVRAEYRYSDFGTFNENPFNSAPGSFVQHHETENEVLAGFSYKFDAFGPAPVAAKY